MNKTTIERLALPMFVAGIVAIVLSATVMLTNPAFAATAAGYKMQTVTLEYVSTGFIFNGSSCGRTGSATTSAPNFGTKAFGIRDNDKWGKCSVTLTVLTK